MVTALNLDNAVMVFGTWVENHLNERDQDGKPIYTLNRLLDIELTRAEKAEQNKNALWMLRMMSGQYSRGDFQIGKVVN